MENVEKFQNTSYLILSIFLLFYCNNLFAQNSDRDISVGMCDNGNCLENCIVHSDSGDSTEYSQSTTCYYLYPYNLHLTNAITSAEPLVIKNDDGNIISGTLNFFGYDQTLISISADGYVTALRQENPDEIGTWVSATINGQTVANACIVRVLSINYNITFIEETRANTKLYYPDSIKGENISAYVAQYEIPAVIEYFYTIQQELMGLQPSNGCKQIIEVDFGETEQQRVCGISGNPLRLGWNIAGNIWQNCFLVPFFPPRSPQWFIFAHEMGHNFTWDSAIFAQALGTFLYSEGMASSLGLECYEKMMNNPSEFPLQNDAKTTIQAQVNQYQNTFQSAFQTWINRGAIFSELTPDIIDGIYYHYKANYSGNFEQRFYLPLQPEFTSELSGILSDVAANGENGKHTFFAALISAAIEEDASQEFITTYHYPIVQTLFDNAYPVLKNLMDINGAIKDQETNSIERFTLYNNYPNPFNPSTTISYQIQIPGNVVVKIFNTLGQEVITLVNKRQFPGSYSVIWDGKNNEGQRMSSGTYLYKLSVDGVVKVKKMLMVK